MTVSPLHPKIYYGNATDAIAGAFLQVLDMKAAAKADKDTDPTLACAAYEGMMDTVASEGISSDAHAALAIAAAIWRVEEMASNMPARIAPCTPYDLIVLEHLSNTLRHLWYRAPKPPEIAPIAAHFELEM